MADAVGEKLSDLVVVVPGILGSHLARVDSDGCPHEVWGTGSAALLKNLLTFGRRVKGLSIDPAADPDAPADGIIATRLIKDFQLIPGFLGIAGYDGLANRLRRDNHLAADQVIGFPYDWRLSNRVSGTRLAGFLDEKVTEWREKNKRDDLRAILICHSMGGLVARWCTELESGHELVSRTITIGTPYKGAGMALEALVNGVRLPRHIGLRFDTLVRSLPSVRELLPTYSCVRAAGTLKHLDEIDVLPTAWVSDGLDFHRELAAAVNSRTASRTDTLDAFRGGLQPTLTSASLGGDGVLNMHESSDGTEDGRDDRGDGTVPRDSATPPEWTNPALAKAVAQRHASMQLAPSVHTELNVLLTDAPRLMSGRAQIGLRLPSAIAAGQRFVITVEGRAGLGLAAELRLIDGSATAMQRVPAKWDDDRDHYRMQVGPLTAGLHGVRVVRSSSRAPLVDEISDTVLAYSDAEGDDQ
jgi:pimeloyl-ACP methyl ester carboxylesterase